MSDPLKLLTLSYNHFNGFHWTYTYSITDYYTSRADTTMVDPSSKSAGGKGFVTSYYSPTSVGSIPFGHCTPSPANIQKKIQISLQSPTNHPLYLGYKALTSYRLLGAVYVRNDVSWTWLLNLKHRKSDILWIKLIWKSSTRLIGYI